MKRSSSNARIKQILISCLLLVAFWACNDPGSVDGDIGGGEADVVIDTLSVGDFSSRSMNYYSGNFTYFAAGSYNDPLFGNMSAKGLLKPGLPALSDTLETNVKMLMRLRFDNSQLYGDSTASQKFNLYRIEELWRGNAFEFQDDISLDPYNGPVGGSSLFSFSVGPEEDSVDVSLPQSWINEYKEFANNDSSESYRKNSHGLAVVPENSNKIMAIDTDSSRFVIQNPSADTFSVGLQKWASSFERTNTANIPTGSTVLHSTNEKFLQFDLDLSNFKESSQNISRGEFVIYRNNDLLNSSLSSEPPSIKRPDISAMRIFLIDPDQLPDNITPGSPIAGASYSKDDNAYHLDLTAVVINKLNKAINNDKKLVMVLSNNGAIKSTVVYNNNAPDPKKRPKLIVTSLKN